MNPARGEVSLVVDGRARVLCLTLGALAAIEAALGAEGLQALAERLKRLSAADLLAVLGALLRGGGEAGPGGGRPRRGAVFRARAVSAVPYADWLALAARLGVPPREFWRLSLREWRALTTAVSPPAPMRRAELAALLARHGG